MPWAKANDIYLSKLTCGGAHFNFQSYVTRTTDAVLDYTSEIRRHKNGELINKISYPDSFHLTVWHGVSPMKWSTIFSCFFSSSVCQIETPSLTPCTKELKMSNVHWRIMTEKQYTFFFLFLSNWNNLYSLITKTLEAMQSARNI